ncbi:MAG: phospholipase D-like domain-containing protein [Planctomycetota bacterium]
MIALEQSVSLWSDWRIVLAVAGGVIGICTAIHVVLHKHDPRSALLWVGLVVFAPILGALLYATFGINRVARRAVSLRRGVQRREGEPAAGGLDPTEFAAGLGPNCAHLAALEQVLSRVTSRQLFAGNRITPWFDTERARDAMLDAIEGATRSVSLASYLFEADRTGLEFVERLAAARDRGVEVRVLVGEIGLPFVKPRIDAVLRRRGIEHALFFARAATLITGTFNMRNHRKLCVVDGRIGFTGGMNIHDGCRGDAPADRRVLDAHFTVEGPAVSQMQDVFAEDWQFATGKMLRGDLWYPSLEPSGPVVARGIADGPDKRYRKLVAVILGALATAQRRVRIVTPYFLPDQALIGALNVAAMRGVRIDVVVPERTNVRLVRWAMPQVFAQLVESGCRIWAVPGAFDHSKLLVVDDCWSLIGSPNWDTRSLRLNFEFAYGCHDPTLAAAIAAHIDGRIALARAITREQLDARSAPSRVLHGMARLWAPMI